MSTVTVCPNCRDICPSCHSRVKPTAAHGIWACNDCKRKIGSKCCVCHGPKGVGSSTGAGKVCNKCYKMNSCTFCGEHF